MPPRAFRPLPIALTIAGSDSGGGAGIQADLKTFAALGVHGVTAITCLTAQNPRRVLAIQPAKPAIIRAQLQAISDELPPAAIKTGMLYSGAIVQTVADWFRSGPRLPLVVDPVIAATSGAGLAQSSFVRSLTSKLLPLATLVTPNLDEAAVLAGQSPLSSVEQMRSAARRIHTRFGCAVLVKGGHLRRLRQAIDIFWDGQSELLLEAPRVPGVHTHGTGCTYSAAIAAHLALGYSLPRSVTAAKVFMTQAIAQSNRIASHQSLNPLWQIGFRY